MGSNRDDLLAALAIAAVVVVTIALAALLPAHRGVPSTAGLADRDPTCAEWTDGCVTCLRTPQGPSCSTPGIACVRGALECLRKQGS
jgi:hypothetical protein